MNRCYWGIKTKISKVQDAYYCDNKTFNCKDASHTGTKNLLYLSEIAVATIHFD